MKHSRRDFFKGALAGIFGAFLTWAGAVQGEEPAEEILGFPQGGYLSVSPNANIDDLPCGEWGPWTGTAWNIKVNGREQISDNVDWGYKDETGGAPAIDLGKWTPGTTWFVDLVDGDDSNDGLSPETGLQTRAEAVSRCAASSADIILMFPGDGTVEAIPDPCPSRGAVWNDVGSGFGHYVHWSINGSDENGAGTYEDPVATEACARAIASPGQSPYG